MVDEGVRSIRRTPLVYAPDWCAWIYRFKARPY